MSVMEATTSSGEFADAERERLSQLEETIASGLDAYVRVGRALEEIRTRRLYLLTHETFREYLADRWNLSHPRGFALCYSAQVADVLEAAGEHPAGAEAALREFHPVLHQQGAAATVEAFRAVADDGTLPPTPETRRRLAEAGVVDRPERSAADTLQARLTSLEKLLPRLQAHAGLTPLFYGYANRLRDAAAKLDTLADETAPPLPPDVLCIGHGARRSAKGLCLSCRRRDVPAPRDR